MAAIRRLLAGALLGAGACALLAACGSMPIGPVYTDLELQAKCEREGGWWRGYLIPEFCEPQSATLP